MYTEQAFLSKDVSLPMSIHTRCLENVRKVMDAPPCRYFLHMPKDVF